MSQFPVLTYLLLFMAGTAAGSFLNVVVCRYRTGQSIIRPASRCPYCSEKLAPRDLIPLFSIIVLKGRCRFCNKGLPLRYPLFELISAGVFLYCYHFFGLGPLFVRYVVFLSLLLVVSGIDIDNHIIPNRYVAALFLWTLGWYFILLYPPLESALLGLMTGGGLFYVIAVLSKGGIGGGDIKLMAVLGFEAGWPYVLVVFMLAFLLGAAVGVALLVCKKKQRKEPLAFAPFMSVSFFISIFWGMDIWEWYISFLF